MEKRHKALEKAKGGKKPYVGRGEKKGWYSKDAKWNPNEDNRDSFAKKLDQHKGDRMKFR